VTNLALLGMSLVLTLHTKITDTETMNSRLRIALALIPAAVLVAGCGQSSSTSTTSSTGGGSKVSAGIFHAAGQKMLDAGSVKGVMVETVHANGQLITIHMSMESAYKPVRASVHATTTVPTGKVIPMDERVIGKTVYLRSAALEQLPSLAHKWLAFDFSKLSGTSGATGNGVDQASQTAAYLQSIGANAKVVGRQTVNGVDTTHYTAVVSYDQMLKRLPKTFAKAAAKTRAVFAGVKIPLDVWIGSDGRLVADEARINLHGVKVVSRFTVTGYGIPVNVSAPPEQLVVSLPNSVLESILSGQSSAT
jgi:hypothetical protein